MLQKKHRLHGLLLIAAVVISGCGAPETAEPPKVGDTIADATFTGLDEGSVSLASLRDRLVVLHFWATWCAPCRKEMPSLERLSQRLDTNRFVLVGVSVDEDRNLVREFKLKYGIKFAKYIDSDMALARGRFGVTAFPETFIIGRDGKLLRHMMGELEWDTPAMTQLLNDAYNGVTTKTGAYW